MAKILRGMGGGAGDRLMLGAAIRAVEQHGYSLKRQPGRGLTAVYDAIKGSDKFVLIIRTTRDRRFAFPSRENGKAWKTLANCDLVTVAAVDNIENPQAVNVYLFRADEVRRRIDASHFARTSAGHNVKDHWGIWVMLDKGDDSVTSQAGHSLAVDYPEIATFALDELAAGIEVAPDARAFIEDAVNEEKAEPSVALNTVAEVLAFAQDRIAALTGMPVQGVKINLTISV